MSKAPEPQVSSAVATGAVIVIAMIFLIIRATLGSKKKPKDDNPLEAPPIIPIHPMILPRKSQEKHQVDSPVKLSAINMMRELVGPVPRDYPNDLQEYLHVEPPFWLSDKKKDETLDSINAQEHLRRNGKIVWAAIVQANDLIYDHGPVDHCASVLWSDDPYYDQKPQELAEIAKELFEIKGTDQADPEVAGFSRMLANEKIRAPRLKVPLRYTSGKDVYHSSLMLTRKHLVNGYLSFNLMPIWIDPEPTGKVLIVPAAYWPPSLTKLWNRD